MSTGTRDDDGAAFFHTYSSGDLGIVNNLLVISKDQIDKVRYDRTRNGNERVVMEAKIDPFIYHLR